MRADNRPAAPPTTCGIAEMENLAVERGGGAEAGVDCRRDGSMDVTAARRRRRLAIAAAMAASACGSAGTGSSPASGTAVTQQAFAIRVDSTCARDYNGGVSQEKELKDLEALGEPPSAQSVYDQWLDNVRQRTTLAAQAQAAAATGDVEKVNELVAQALVLKKTGNGLGEEFGLVVCVSNGPQPIINGWALSFLDARTDETAGGGDHLGPSRRTPPVERSAWSANPSSPGREQRSVSRCEPSTTCLVSDWSNSPRPADLPAGVRVS